VFTHIAAVIGRRFSVLAILLTLCALGLSNSVAGARSFLPAGESEWTAAGGPWDASGDARLFAVDTLADHTVYAVIESSGISTLYRTTNDGATWSPRSSIPKRMGALAARAGVVYAGLDGAAAGEDAILRSADGGATWTPVMTASDTTTVNFFDMLPSPSTALYAAASVVTNGVVLYSADGLTWGTRYSRPGTMLRVTVNPADTARVFASGQNGTSGNAEVSRTLNSGGAWGAVLSVAGEGMEAFLQVHPTDPSRVFVSTRGYDCCPPPPPSLYRSDDGGDTWHVVSYTQVFNLTFGLPDSIYCISQAFRVTHDASSVTPTWSGEFALSNEFVHGGVVDTRPTNPVIYAGLPLSGIYISTDDGASFAEANSGVSSLLRPHALVADPQAPTTVYAATDKGVFRSNDSGDTWSSHFPRVIAREVAIHPTNSDLLLATAEDGKTRSPWRLIYRSANGGLDWTLVFDRTISDGHTHGGWEVAFDPTDPNYAYATTAAWDPGAESTNQLLRSTDGGLTWANIRDNHGQVPGMVVIEVASDGTLYYGGKEGWQGEGRGVLYRSDTHGDTWTEVYTHDSGWRVKSLSIDPQVPDSLTMIVAENTGTTHLLNSLDRGDAWEELAPGLESSMPAVAGAAARRIEAAFEPLTNLQSITHDPARRGRIFLGANGPVVLVSNDNGHTWSEVGGWGAQDAAPEVAALAVNHAVEARTLFAGLGGNGEVGMWRRSVPLYEVYLPLVMR